VGRERVRSQTLHGGFTTPVNPGYHGPARCVLSGKPPRSHPGIARSDAESKTPQSAAVKSSGGSRSTERERSKSGESGRRGLPSLVPATASSSHIASRMQPNREWPASLRRSTSPSGRADAYRANRDIASRSSINSRLNDHSHQMHPIRTHVCPADGNSSRYVTR